MFGRMHGLDCGGMERAAMAMMGIRGGHGPRGFGGPEGTGRDGGWHGGGGRRRMFDGGELRLVLLKLIGDAPRHGYDLIREIEALTGGAYAPSPGVVYPTLTLLGDMGLIAPEQSDDSRKRFAITAEGQAHLAENGEVVAALLARLGALGTVAQRTDGGAVKRAVMNLRAVLQNKLAGDEIEPETLHAAVALIDEAAQKIERL
jgi:DNA-binding PadR family transcriptional regulator